ncbi:MAG: hypothetical protein ACKV2Q_17355 [Planctomycetaceae bacterium]
MSRRTPKIERLVRRIGQGYRSSGVFRVHLGRWAFIALSLLSTTDWRSSFAAPPAPRPGELLPALFEDEEGEESGEAEDSEPPSPSGDEELSRDREEAVPSLQPSALPNGRGSKNSPPRSNLATAREGNANIQLLKGAAGPDGAVPPAPAADNENIQPPVLRRPLEPTFTETDPLLTPEMPLEPGVLFAYPVEAPLGYTGPSSILPSEGQESSHFVPMEDRWRAGFPAWDRYGKGHPPVDDYPYLQGNILDPYNQNVIKGDYPIIGQHTFLTVTGTSLSILEARQVPTPTTPFESTGGPDQNEFFGDPNQFLYVQNFVLSFDLVHGNGAFKPADWRIKMTTIANMNYLDVNELGIVNPDVRYGQQRFRADGALEEWFFETKIADTSPYYDFMSVRAGSQFFSSDFRGFIFHDTNRAVRLFGTNNANRDQYNVIFFDQTEKQSNSGLNTWDDRHQNTVIANYYRQDFIWPGYTAEASFHYNNDGPSFEFDKNDNLVRPDGVGIFQPHEVEAYYLGFAGDGHINRFNISHAFYWVLGRDSLNPLAGKPQNINAQMAALELSYDRDWARFRTSVFWASGDENINDEDATGFDTILDNPNFAGGGFSYWQRQTIGLFGVNLTQRQSLVADLRSSKTQGQSNFVNPGLFLVNVGADFDITPKLRSINNCNFLWFDETDVLQRFVFQEHVGHRIGTDLSTGVEYRPFLNNNVVFVGGVSTLIPGDGFNDLFRRTSDRSKGFFASFMEIDFTY